MLHEQSLLFKEPNHFASCVSDVFALLDCKLFDIINFLFYNINLSVTTVPREMRTAWLGYEKISLDGKKKTFKTSR